MLHASLTVDPAFRVADVSPRTFGSFVEHMGRCVYTGIYEPGHSSADEDGLRRDVLDLVRELGVTAVRYPGGDFVSGFRWEDSVGLAADRPTRLDLAWHSTETNAFGLHEFQRWAGKAGVEPMMAVNLGTRGVAEALDLLEYCNHPGGTAWSDQRIKNGAPDPFGIRMWCLGNELDGPWQTGHKTAQEYGRIAAETARAMRMVDPGLELVACGSSSSSMPTFGAWEATVLEEAYDQVDYISCHAYYEELDGDLGSFLASGVDMDHFVESVVATADHIRAKLGRKKRINLSFDEWNVWYNTRFEAQGKPTDWAVAPRVIEDEYNVADAVVVGGLLISLLRNSDRVTAACLAQLVNVIAPIRSEPGGPSWRQTTFHPFAQAARHARGTVLRVEPVAPVYETKRFGEVSVVDAVATHDGDELTVFAVNRHQSDNVELALDLRAFPGHVLVEHSVLSDPDVRAANTQDDPDRVRPYAADAGSVTGGRLTASLPPVSTGLNPITYGTIDLGGGISDGATYTASNANSHLMLTIAGGSTTNGLGATQQNADNASDQKWKFVQQTSGYFKIFNVASGKVLGVTNQSTANGAKVVQWDDNGTLDHEWAIAPNPAGGFTATNRISGKYLEIPSASTAVGTAAGQWADTGCACQRWNLTQTALPNLATGQYRLVNKHSGELLEIPGASTTAGKQAGQWVNTANNCQLWTFQSQSGGAWTVKNVNSGLFLDSNGSTSAGAAVVQKASSTASSQQWTLTDAGGGYYKLVNPGSGLVADVASASTANGALIVQSADNGADDELWQVVRIN